jgi:hypothetical protein
VPLHPDPPDRARNAPPQPGGPRPGQPGAGGQRGPLPAPCGQHHGRDRPGRPRRNPALPVAVLRRRDGIRPGGARRKEVEQPDPPRRPASRRGAFQAPPRGGSRGAPDVARVPGEAQGWLLDLARDQPDRSRRPGDGGAVRVHRRGPQHQPPQGDRGGAAPEDVAPRGHPRTYGPGPRDDRFPRHRCGEQPARDRASRPAGRLHGFEAELPRDQAPQGRRG